MNFIFHQMNDICRKKTSTRKKNCEDIFVEGGEGGCEGFFLHVNLGVVG